MLLVIDNDKNTDCTKPYMPCRHIGQHPSVLLPLTVHAQTAATLNQSTYTNALTQAQVQSLVNAANQSDELLRQLAAELMAQSEAVARSVYLETQGLVSEQQSLMLEQMYLQRLANSVPQAPADKTGASSFGWIAGGALAAGLAAAAGGGGGGGGSSSGPAPTPPNSDGEDPVAVDDSQPTLTPEPSLPGDEELPSTEDPGSVPDPGPLPGDDDSDKSLALSNEHLTTNGYNLTYGHVAHERGFTGEGQKIAIIDSGINSSHLELTGQIDGHYNLLTGSTAESSAQDSGGHGTHVAGTLVARRNNTGVVGYAYGARLLNVRFTDANDAITATDQQLANGFAWARNNGATWFNNSWGVDTTVADFGRTGVAANFPKLLAEWQAGAQDGRIYVWATGNDGEAQPLLFAALPQLYPELQFNWVAVTSVDSDTGTLSTFANACGNAAAWCLAAPGTNIVSSYTGSNSAYAIASGTSQATPAVTGGLAVISHAFPTLAPEQVVQRLLVTANKEGIYADQSLYGQGLMDLEKATRPVGTLSVVSSSGAALSVDDAMLVLGGAFGYDNPLSGLQVMATDALQAGFSVDLGKQVQTRRFRYDTGAAWQRLGRNWDTQAENGWAMSWTTSSKSGTTSRVAHFGQPGEHRLSIGQIDDLDMLDMQRSWAGYSQLDASMSSALWLQRSEEHALGIRQRLPAGNFSVDLTATASSVRQGVSVALNLPPLSGYYSRLEVGHINSRDGLFDSRGHGAFDLDNISQTLFAGLRGDYTDGPLTLGHAFYLGESHAQAAGLFQDLGKVTTSSWILAGRYVMDTSTFGMLVQQPLRVESAQTRINVAPGYAGNLFDMQSVTLDLSPTGRQINLELFWQKPLWRDSDIKLSWLGIREPGHQAKAAPMQVIMGQWQQRF